MSHPPIPDAAPRVLSEWRDRILAASEAGRALELRGGGTKAFYGEAPRGEPFDTREYRGIVSFEPTELVITARCGTPLAELEAAVAQAGQMLPFEPPSFGAQATLGGAMATGLSGPRRATAGAMRDFVLGACLLDAKGQWLRFGGQVMKNVAGYDVSRVLCGSMGMLGLITEVSLKVLPVPALETTLMMAADQKQALGWLNQWAGRPLPISASAWSDGKLIIRLSGAAAAAGGLVHAKNFQADGREAARRKVPLLLLFSTPGCPYCERVKREYLIPMHKDPAYRNRVLIREVTVGATTPLVDFNGATTTEGAFATAHKVIMVPTVQVLDTEGVEASEAIVGLLTPDYYFGYLEAAIDNGGHKVRGK